MLHIMLLILKIIGIILAVMLGILVLLICIVLFVPVSYQGSAKCDGTAETLCGILKVSWMFRLLQFNAKYENGTLKYSVHIAWKKITGGISHEKTTKEVHKEVQKEVQQETTNESPSTGQVSDQKNQKVVQEPQKEPDQEAPKPEESISLKEKNRKTNREETKDKTTEKAEEKTKATNHGFRKKAVDLYNEIKCTIKNICDKLKVLLEKKDKVLGFIQDKNHIKALNKLKWEAFKLLKRLCPKQFAVKVKYGFDDPSITGRVLAGLSMLYPFTEDHMEIVPDFENKILMGRGKIQGRIYVIHFVCTVWNLIWCRQVRLLYKDVRNFKL